LGYLLASFDRLLGMNFHADLATPLDKSLQWWPGQVTVTWVTVTPGSSRPTHGPWPTPVATLQINLIYLASAIGMDGTERI